MVWKGLAFTDISFFLSFWKNLPKMHFSDDSKTEHWVDSDRMALAYSGQIFSNVPPSATLRADTVKVSTMGASLFGPTTSKSSPYSTM